MNKSFLPIIKEKKTIMYITLQKIDELLYLKYYKFIFSFLSILVLVFQIKIQVLVIVIVVGNKDKMGEK